jgi:MFS family permease
MSRSQRIVLVLILTGQLMAVLDASIVNVAIPTIRLDLHASGADLQLIVAGYVIAYAVLLITGARLGSRYGFRTAFLWGLGIFTAGSLACGLAPTSGTLIVLRALQGMGAALMVPRCSA